MMSGRHKFVICHYLCSWVNSGEKTGFIHILTCFIAVVPHSLPNQTKNVQCPGTLPGQIRFQAVSCPDRKAFCKVPEIKTLDAAGGYAVKSTHLCERRRIKMAEIKTASTSAMLSVSSWDMFMNAVRFSAYSFFYGYYYFECETEELML